MHIDEKHWTDDAELIERFVLNNLNPDKRNELEDHLRICEVCKQAVRAEQVLIAGIRRSGREALKVELKNKVKALPQQTIPWGHIISAAALIVIIAGVGIYNRWFQTLQVVEDSTAILPAKPDSALAKVPSHSPVTSPELQSEAAFPETHISASKATGEGTAGIAKRTPPRSSQPMVVERKEHLAGTQTELRDVEEPEPARIAGDEPSAGSAVVEKSIWLTGEMIRQLDDEREKRETGEMRTAAAKKDVRPLGAGQSTATEMKPHARFIIKQLPSRELPPQQLQAHQQYGTIFARAERIGNATQLSLYLDETLEEAALAQIEAETPTPDSLILLLQNTHIVFKVLPGWETSLQQIPAK